MLTMTGNCSEHRIGHGVLPVVNASVDAGNALAPSCAARTAMCAKRI
jgi:hypothetical protein